VLSLVAQSGWELQFASEELRGDRDVVLAAIAKDAYSIHFASQEFKHDAAIIASTKLLRPPTYNTAKADIGDPVPGFVNDRRYLYLASHNYSLTLDFASDELKDDEQFVRMIANFTWCRTAEFMSPRLRNNKHVMLTMLCRDNCSFQYASDALKRNPGFVLFGLAQGNWSMYDDVPNELKGDEAFVEAAFTINGLAIEFGTDGDRADRKLAAIAVESNPSAFEYINDELRADRNIALIAVSRDGRALQHAPPALKADKEIVLAAVSSNGDAIQFASPELQKDLDVISAAVCRGGYIELANTAQRSEKSIALLAVQKDDLFGSFRNAYCLTDTLLQYDKDVAKAAVIANSEVMDHLPAVLRRDREFILSLFNSQTHVFPSVFEKIDDSLKFDRDFVIEVCRYNGYVLQYLSNSFRSDRIVVDAAVSNSGSALQFSSDDLKVDEGLQQLSQSFSRNRFSEIVHDFISDNEDHSNAYVRNAVKEFRSWVSGNS
jgi:hypothetical protein